MQWNIFEMGFIFLNLSVHFTFWFSPCRSTAMLSSPSLPFCTSYPVWTWLEINLKGIILKAWPCKHKYSTRYSSNPCKKVKLKRWNDTPCCKPVVTGAPLSKLINPSQVQPTHPKPQGTHTGLFFFCLFFWGIFCQVVGFQLNWSKIKKWNYSLFLLS